MAEKSTIHITSCLNPRAMEFYPRTLLPSVPSHPAVEPYLTSLSFPDVSYHYHTNFRYIQPPTQVYSFHQPFYHRTQNQTPFSFINPPRAEQPLPQHVNHNPRPYSHIRSLLPSSVRRLPSSSSFPKKGSTVRRNTSSSTSTDNNHTRQKKKTSKSFCSRVFQPSSLNMCVSRGEQTCVVEPTSFSRRKDTGRKKKLLEEMEPILPVKKDGQETSVMIRNIPNQYTRKMLIEFLDYFCDKENEKNITDEEEEEGEENEKNITDEEEEEGELVAYDFVYLPIDFSTNLNKGYAFVNFTTSKAAWRLYLANLSDQTWQFYDSVRKRREIAIAKIQGKRALIKHFELSTFVCNTEEYLPVIFSPPRTGFSEENQKKLKKKSQLQQKTVAQKILGRLFRT